MARTDDGTCDRCGVELRPRQCTAHCKRGGKHCRNDARHDMDVCRMHGGTAPQAIAAAERRREEAEAVRAVHALGLPRDVDPHTALLEELHRTAGLVATYEALVVNDGVGGLVVTTMFGPKPSGWVQELRKERKHLADVAAACVRAGVDAARTQLAEQQGLLLVEVIKGIVGDLGHDPAAPDVREVVGRRLRLVAGPALTPTAAAG